MASKTTNLGLSRPTYTEQVDVTVLNRNWTLVDAAIGDHEKRLKALEGTGASGDGSGTDDGTGGSSGTDDTTQTDDKVYFVTTADLARIEKRLKAIEAYLF